MKKFIIAGIFLLFPLLALAHGGVNDDELIIRMTPNGFEPKELTVVQGDEVLFINNDEVDRWPASNFHPTHTLYPEFDPKTHVKPGESWKFTFEKTGTWRFHDHLFPHMTGTIVVLEDANATIATPANASSSDANSPLTPGNRGLWQKLKNFLDNFWHRIFSQASGNSSVVDEALLKEFKGEDEQGKYAWLEKRAEIENPKVAWQYVLAAYQTPEGVVGKPHDMAHLVGQLLFKAYGLEGLATCTPVFAFGCYHGLMEVAFDKNDSEHYQENILKAEKACANMGTGFVTGSQSCIHGMGHGIITFRNHDLNKALNDCDALETGWRNYCYDGVFMELSISAAPSFYQKSDPLYPCNTLGENYQTACARSQTIVMRQRFGLNTRNIAEVCAKSTPAIKYNCIDSLGYYVGQTNIESPQNIVSGCEEIFNKDDQAQCKAAAAGELVFQDARGWHENVSKICESLNASSKTLCDTRVANVKQSYGRK
jgi:plastocyanin